MDKQADQEDLTLLLPDDALAAVLARLAPRGLAVSRGVCRAWRAVVDARRLLRTDLLPFHLGGVFLETWGTNGPNRFPALFSQPSAARPAIGDDLGYLDLDGADTVGSWYIEGHCAGLLLFSECVCDDCPGVWSDHVVNPATRQRTRLPPRPALPLGMKDFYHNSYLMFDPANSPHYEVLLVPEVPCWEQPEDPPATEELEWPPSPYAMGVFSSRSGNWEERLFIREGPAMGLGTIAEIKGFPTIPDGYYSVYWRGILYVQCVQNFVMRINPSTGSYHLIAPPVKRIPGHGGFHLGKSEKGVYYGKISFQCELFVWFLDESDGRAQWVLKCHRDLSPLQARRNYDEHINGPWFLQCYGREEDYTDTGEFAADDDETDLMAEYIAGLDEEALEEEISQSGSAYDYIRYAGSLTFLGFHPYKEIVFLNFLKTRGLAYHLNTSKMQDLGSFVPERSLQNVSASFVYTPCWM